MWIPLRQNSTLAYIALFSQMFNLYIKQAAEIFGVTHTREIYEKAIEVLPDEQARWAVYYWWENKVMKSTLRVITFKCGIETAIKVTASVF